MGKNKIVKSRISEIEPSASNGNKKRKMPFVTPELKRIGSLQNAVATGITLIASPFNGTLEA